MDDHRARAIRLALEEIDRHLGEYNTTEKQHTMLAALIEEHDLMDRPRSLQGQTIQLVVKRFDNIINTVANSHSRPGSSSRGRKDLFYQGSAMVAREYLQQAGFNRTVVADSFSASEPDHIPAMRAETEPPQQRLKSFEGPPSAPSAVSAPNLELSAPTPSPIMIPDDEVAEGRVHPRKRQRTSEESYREVDESREQPQKRQRASEESYREVASSASAREPVPKAAQASPETVVKTAMVKTPLVNTPLVNTPLVNTPLVNTPVVKSQTSSVPNLADNLVKVSVDSISKDLSVIWTLIQNAARSILGGKVNPDEKAAWVSEPHGELEIVYQRLFSPNWKPRLREISSTLQIKRKDALEGCIASAIFEYAFNRRLPWPGPQQMVENLQGDAGFIEQVLKASGSTLDLETLLWHAARLKAEDRGVQKNVIQPEAEKLAETIMLVLDRQLDALGIMSSDQQRATEVARIIGKVLVLKSRLRAAPDYYEFRWIRSGAELDRSRMEEVNEGDGRQEVMWTVSPVVRVRATKEDPWVSVCPAKVFTRPLEEKP